MNETTTSAPAKPAKVYGYPHSCIRCGDENCVRIDLNDLGNFICTACEAEWTLADVETLVSQWTRIVVWIRSSAAYEE